ncbi:oxidoreductase [Catellatospora methionotrophica]|uniref:Oxidoreductase n=1 Tax=Catellatospora methionotrophica TaxID=121620 RepID=A0A8J3L6H8_9ACTN|nr:flavin reductase family protein [Catellatospora methionotrophica]GIG15338.1 oxidoreductase [Catellatospora methionotrophica]
MEAYVNTQATPHVSATDRVSLRRAFGTFATGVTVVTVGGATPHGMTANSFTTVSLDPPLVLICVGREAVMHNLLGTTGTFAVSVLAAHQARLARYFADRGRPMGRRQFDDVDCVPGPRTGAPLLAEALAHFECEVRHAYDGGDHTIFLAEAVALRRGENDAALLFLQGKFRQIEPDHEVKA